MQLIFQEAMSILIDIKGEKNVSIGKLEFDENALRNFKNYVSIMKSHNRNLPKAHRFVQPKYGNTYWYYLDYWVFYIVIEVLYPVVDSVFL